MSILHPGFLWLLIPLGVLFVYRERKLTETVHLIILACLVLAMSRPVLLRGVQESPIEAKEYIVALDVSYSMRAKDIAPNRYDFARKTLSSLLALHPEDNVMLYAFTSNPLILSPPTTDHQLIETALKSLNPDYILTKGTSMERLFRQIASMKKKEKYLIVMTDGGEEKEIQKLLSILQKGHITPIVLALGTASGATVTQKDGSLLKDRDGHLVVSRINPLLEPLASAAGGVYLTASASPEATARALYDALRSLQEETQLISKTQHSYTELYTVFLLPALLLFLLLHTRAVRYLLFLLPFLGLQAEASMLDGYRLHKAYAAYEVQDLNTSEAYLKALSAPSLQSRFALAGIYYRRGQYDKALATYQSIQSTSAKTKQKLYYNIANCYAMQEAYEKAKIYYTKALQLGEDDDAQANLALVALLKEKQKSKLGISHPKSQDGGSSKSQKKEAGDEQSSNENQSGSGSGSGGRKKKSGKEQERRRLLLDPDASPQPLSSKVYELINKGYIHEQNPW